LDTKSPWLRFKAAEALGQLHDEQAVEPLIKLLRLEKEYRSDAARSLGELGDKRAVTPLIEALNDDSFSVQMAAERTLNEMSDPRA
jgi:HEAT repeat protein